MGIHDVNYECPSKPKRVRVQNKYSEVNAEIKKFRNGSRWQNKREEIQERDNRLCQICIRELYNTIDRFTYEGLSVHHIKGLAQEWDSRLDNYNLITLCSQHHTDADLGVIPASLLMDIAREQEDKVV